MLVVAAVIVCQVKGDSDTLTKLKLQAVRRVRFE
jgi:hypothetical protein